MQGRKWGDGEENAEKGEWEKGKKASTLCLLRPQPLLGVNVQVHTLASGLYFPVRSDSSFSETFSVTGFLDIFYVNSVDSF